MKREYNNSSFSSFKKETGSFKQSYDDIDMDDDEITFVDTKVPIKTLKQESQKRRVKFEKQITIDDDELDDDLLEDQCGLPEKPDRKVMEEIDDDDDDGLMEIEMSQQNQSQISQGSQQYNLERPYYQKPYLPKKAKPIQSIRATENEKDEEAFLFYDKYYEKTQVQWYKVISAQDLFIPLQSVEFKEFVEFIPKLKMCVCLTCWQFVTYAKKQYHQQIGHQTATPSELYDEKSFLQYARNCQKINTLGRVQVLKPRSFEKQSSDNQADELKTENRGRKPHTSLFFGAAKNVPPFLSAYLKPFQLVPRNQTQQAIDENYKIEQLKKTGNPKQQQLAYQLEEQKKKNGFKADIMSYGQINLGFRGEGRAQMCKIFKQFSDDLCYMQTQHDEIISSLKQAIQGPGAEIDYVVPSDHVQRHIAKDQKKQMKFSMPQKVFQSDFTLVKDPTMGAVYPSTKASNLISKRQQAQY